MFVNIVHFPPIKPGKDDEFPVLFAMSNEEFSKCDGFIGRRLLKPRAGGNYAAVVEHSTYESFQAMHTSPVQAEMSRRVQPMFDGELKAEFYEVIVN